MRSAKNLVGLGVGAACLLSVGLAAAGMSPRQIYQTRGPGVVLIVASQEGSSSASAGTGSIIHADGLVITNSHVVFDAGAKAPYPVIHVFLKPERVSGDMNKDLSRHHAAELMAYDNDLDLALLKLKSPPPGLTVISLGDPEQVGPGDEIIAIGHPEQGGLWTITRGVIGAEFENFKGVAGKHVFQMDTSLNRGNSGGPAFDVRGHQVGVNTAIARKGEGGIAITGVNFAVKSAVVKDWAARHNVRLAYGSGALDDGGRVALADASPPPPAPGPASPPPARPPASDDGRTYKDPSGRGGITVEEGYGEDEGEEYVPGPTEVQRKAAPGRRPQRFERHYRLPPRPYTFPKLFTAVDRVRQRAQDAFDDLDAEIKKRGR